MNKHAVLSFVLLFLVFDIAQSKEITLRDAVLTALKSNPMVSIYEAKVAQQEANRFMVFSQFLPTVSFDNTYYRYRQDPMPVVEGFGWSLTLNWNFFSGFSTVNYYRESLKLLDAAKSYYYMNELDVAMRVVNAYMAALKVKELVESAKADLEDAETNYKLAKKRYEVGLTPLADLYNAEARVEEARYNLTMRMAEYEKAKIELLVSMGYSVFEDIEPKSVVVALGNVDLKKFVEEALKKRPEILAIKSEVEAQKNRVKAVMGEYLPKLDFSASYGQQDKSYFPNDRENWNIGVKLTVPVFEGFSTTSKLKRERAVLIEKENNLRKVELDVSQDVFNKYQDFVSIKKSLESAEALLKASEEDLRMMRGRYVNGLVSIVDLTTTQARLSEARAKYVTTKYELFRAYYSLIRAVGDIPGLEGER